MSNELQIKIKKDSSFRNILDDFDRILTAMSDMIKLDLSDTTKYSTLDVTGVMSNTGIVAVTTEKLQTARKITIAGDALGECFFDGSTDTSINVSIAKIKNTSVDNLFGVNANDNMACLYAINADTATSATSATTATTAVNASATKFTIPRTGTTGGTLFLAGNTDNINYVAIDNNYTVLRIYGVDPVYKNIADGYVLTYTPATGELSAETFTGKAADTGKISGVACNNTTTAPTGTTRVNINGYVYATRTYATESADYAECFDSNGLIYEDIKHRIVEVDDNGKLQLGTFSSKRVVGIVSDNYGHLLNGSEEDIKNNIKIPVGLAGVLYVDSIDKVEKYNIGNLICSDNNGYAKVLMYPIFGISVGKIIDVDEENNRYKIIISLV